jgi:hypothetical protein
MHQILYFVPIYVPSTILSPIIVVTIPGLLHTNWYTIEYTMAAWCTLSVSIARHIESSWCIHIRSFVSNRILCRTIAPTYAIDVSFIGHDIISNDILNAIPVDSCTDVASSAAVVLFYALHCVTIPGLLHTNWYTIEYTIEAIVYSQ